MKREPGKAEKVAGVIIGFCIVAIMVAVTYKVIEWIISF